MLLCLTLKGRLPSIVGWQRLTLLAGSVCCWFVASEYQSRFHYPFKNPGAWTLIGEYALGTSGCLLFLIGFLGIDSKVWPAWIVYLGRISFGLYVFHELALETISRLFPQAATPTSALAIVKAALAVGLNIAMATLSFHFLEMPFLRIKKRLAVIRSSP
jgi:peptidoglycan/LPS O-acetylase OafA/YrhL